MDYLAKREIEDILVFLVLRENQVKFQKRVKRENLARQESAEKLADLDLMEYQVWKEMLVCQVLEGQDCKGLRETLENQVWTESLAPQVKREIKDYQVSLVLRVKKETVAYQVFQEAPEWMD